MSEPSHCALQVIRITDIPRRSKDAKLYVKIKVGESIRKTGEISDDGKPGWHGTFTCPRLDASTAFSISLKSKRRFKDDLLGRTEVSVAQLLQESEHEVQLTLQSLHRVRFGRGNPEQTATIVLSYKEIDALSRAEIDVLAAEQSVEQIKDSVGNSESAIAVIGSVIEVVDVMVDVVDKVSEIHPVFNVSWKAASALYKLVSYQYESDRKLVETVEKIKIAYEVSTVAGTLGDRTEMLKPLVKALLNVTIDCSRFVQEYARYSFVGRAPRLLSKERIDDFASRFVALRKDIDTVIGLTTARVADEIRQQQALDTQVGLETNNVVIDMKLQQQLEYHLSPLKSDASDVSKRPRCLEGTRREYLDPIMDFISSDSTPNVLWLTGAAGSGKSTIAVTASDECDKMGCHAAYLFFEREKGEPSSVIRTIAYKLAVLYPSIASRVSEAIRKNKNINGNILKTQFEVLLLGPLSEVEDEGEVRIVIILDALDESGTVEQREELLILLKNEFARLPSKVRVLVTSRPENDIMKDLLSKSNIHHIALEHRSDRSQHDVNRYIRETMSRLVGEAAANEEGWDDKMQILCDAADGLFIWASTAIKMVKRSDVMEEQLDGLLEDIRSVGGYGIDGLYSTALKDCGIMWRSTKSRERFGRAVGLVVLAKEELSSQVVASFLSFREELVTITLEHLQPVLSFRSGQPVHLHHASFADYLLSDKRSGEQSWHINEVGERQTIAERCFDIMAERLHFNICDIESSFNYNIDIPDLQNRIKENIPPHVSYACRFWAAHVIELPVSAGLASLLVKLKRFAHSHLLYWFEVLSLTGNFNRVAVRALYEVSLWAAPFDKEISSFMWAAYRLASVFSYPMSQSAPQIYLSAISLWSGESRVADHYSWKYPSVSVHRYGSKPPAQCIKVIRGHKDTVNSVDFSPDGKRVVSGSYDDTVRIWDADTGELVLGPLVGHTGWVTSVAFSPDGKYVVSGSNDKTIRIWSAVSGELVCGPIKGHKGCVNSVAFSPDGNRVVSGSSDLTICVWDANTGELISGPFEGHTGAINAVSFSSDGKRVVSGSADKTIRVWDAGSGILISGPFEGHTGEVNSVAFSRDGMRVISGSDDKTVRVWNLESRELIKMFEGHTDAVSSVAFSVDGKRVVSGSGDKTVIWDSDTGELVAGPFKGHTGRVRSVAFSQDGKRVVSGSLDDTVRIWDADSGPALPDPLEEQESPAILVGFAANGKRAVSRLLSRKFCVWDTDTGELVSDPFEGSSSMVTSVALSPDGGLVASGSGDGMVRVWNTSSGELVSGPLEGHVDGVWLVAFSSDGNKVVSGSSDNTVRIWNVESGVLVSDPLRGHTGWVRSAAFSADGNLVVSGSDDMTIRIWSAISGELVAGPFQGHEGFVTSVAFSPDGEKVISGSADGTIRIWNVDTGEVVSGPFKGHMGPVNSVAFSPDGKRVVSGSIDKTIRIWDAVSGELISTFYGHKGEVLPVAFSPDGRYVYSGSADGTIRKWDVGSGEEVHERASQDLNSNLAASPAALGKMSIAIRDGEALGLDSSGKRLASNWTMEDDGWVVSDRGELLTWVPEDMRRTLGGGRHLSVFGPDCQFSTRLDFSNAPVGEGWSKGFPRRERSIV